MQPVLVSFSGVDGAGKSSQIRLLCERLKELNFEPLALQFWDDVATLTRFREGASHSLFQGDLGIGSPDAPIHRRDKNVRSPLMTLARFVIYLLDTASLRRVIQRARASGAHWIVCDRYIYDELANLNLHNPVSRIYARWVRKLAPKPAVSYLLDADPQKAWARKPEYPLDFLYTCRESYLALNCLLGNPMTVIAPMPIAATAKRVLECAGLPARPESGDVALQEKKA